MIHLVDLSTYQRGVNYAELARAVAGGWVKATDAVRQGDAWVPTLDPMHEQHSLGLRAHGRPTGSYCFGHPTQDHAQSSDFFVQHAWFDQLRPVLDMESLNADQSIPANAGPWARAWVDRTRLNTGVTPIIYASTSYARAMLTQCPSLATEDWWLAAYPGLDVAPDWMPTVKGLEARRVVAWQWTGTGRLPGIVGNADRDVAPSMEPLYVQAPAIA